MVSIHTVSLFQNIIDSGILQSNLECDCFSDMTKFSQYATPMYEDPNLPDGWIRFIKIRACGRNAGRMEVVIVRWVPFCTFAIYLAILILLKTMFHYNSN